MFLTCTAPRDACSASRVVVALTGVWFTSERDKAALRARFVFMHGKVYTRVWAAAARLDPTSHYRTRARYPRLNVGLIASRAGDA